MINPLISSCKNYVIPLFFKIITNQLIKTQFKFPLDMTSYSKKLYLTLGHLYTPGNKIFKIWVNVTFVTLCSKYLKDKYATDLGNKDSTTKSLIRTKSLNILHLYINWMQEAHCILIEKQIRWISWILLRTPYR